MGDGEFLHCINIGFLGGALLHEVGRSLIHRSRSITSCQIFLAQSISFSLKCAMHFLSSCFNLIEFSMHLT